MATLRIDGLQVSGIIGVCDWERRVPQALLLDLELEVDAARPAHSDAIQDALDYGALAADLQAAVAASSFQLIEALAAHLLALVMRRYAPLRCCLTLHKPGAIPAARQVSITLSSD